MMNHFNPNGGGQPPMPPAAATPSAAPPGPPAGAPPPDPHAAAAQSMQHHVDPSNAIQQELLTRASKLTEQDQDAFAQGCTPQAAEVLKKMIPEIGFLIDHVLAGSAPGGAPPMPGAPPSPPGAGSPMPPHAPAPSPQPAASPFPRPTTALARFG
jgi:hypothetical protein